MMSKFQHLPVLVAIETLGGNCCLAVSVQLRDAQERASEVLAAQDSGELPAMVPIPAVPSPASCLQFASRLLSISQLYRDGKATISHPKQGIMVTDADCMDVRVTGIPLLVGKATDNGFVTDIDVMLSKNTVKCVTAPTNTVFTYAQALQNKTSTINTKPQTTAKQLWILRLGFPNPERVIKLAKNNLPTGVKKPRS
jgi:hypothetical protein